MTETMSAKIYQFPAGGRSNYVRRGPVALPATEQAPVTKAAVNFGSGWYHEEAIREDALERNNVSNVPPRQ